MSKHDFPPTLVLLFFNRKRGISPDSKDSGREKKSKVDDNEKMESSSTGDKEEKREETERGDTKGNEQAEQEDSNLLLESEDELLVDEEEAAALLESGSSAADDTDVANLGDVTTEQKVGVDSEATAKTEGNAASTSTAKKLKKV